MQQILLGLMQHSDCVSDLLRQVLNSLKQQIISEMYEMTIEEEQEHLKHHFHEQKHSSASSITSICDDIIRWMSSRDLEIVIDLSMPRHHITGRKIL